LRLVRIRESDKGRREGEIFENQSGRKKEGNFGGKVFFLRVGNGVEGAVIQPRGKDKGKRIPTRKGPPSLKERKVRSREVEPSKSLSPGKRFRGVRERKVILKETGLNFVGAKSKRES